MPRFVSRFLSTTMVALLASSALALETSADTQNLLKDLQQRVLRLEGAPAKSSLNAFNPAIGMALDTALRDSNDKAAFQLRAAELGLAAPVDPYLKAWVFITGSNGGVALEEAVMETTSLPYNLTARGGRLFASFGRLAHFHDHELPVVERPLSLDSYIGGETQADGLEVSWLAPTDLYLNATFGAYNKMGAENDRQDNLGSRAMDEFTYLGRLNTYVDLTEAQNVEMGVDTAWTPKRTVTEDVAVTGSADALTMRRNTWRTLNGVDLTYRHQPSQGGLYKGLIWGAEVMQNSERRFDPTTKLPADRVRAYGGYTYVELKTNCGWRGGLMADLTEDLDDPHRLTKTFTGFLTYDITEFQRLRLTYAEGLVSVPGAVKNHTVALQWTGIIGKHAHGFRDR
ncbi:MAG: hypothetical protein A2506_02145 [Elusimicrobia bacterium RIFOXYD12_FULL_66_9]|nr:MAG: hypothetical protein A2506_02145 [Elusimicrobia bacterium RIFOXYD12_FULL_66_9]